MLIMKKASMEKEMESTFKQKRDPEDRFRGMWHLLGVLEADIVKDKNMKMKIEKGHIKRARKILKSKLIRMNTKRTRYHKTVQLITLQILILYIYIG